jgi:hypothetical protein
LPGATRLIACYTRKVIDPGPKILEPNIRRRRWDRVARDILLLPPALLYVIIERVFWRGAKRLLRQAARIPVVAEIQTSLVRLPVWAVLPLFLVPEFFSHVGGFWATDLLVQRRFLPAMMVGLFIKGTATLMEVWIYQSCEETLLSVRWFAWVHGQALKLRDWVFDRIRPLREIAARLVSGGSANIARRFAALRGVIARRLGLRRE